MSSTERAYGIRQNEEIVDVPVQILQVPTPLSLRACYALSGTHLADLLRPCSVMLEGGSVEGDGWRGVSWVRRGAGGGAVEAQHARAARAPREAAGPPALLPDTPLLPILQLRCNGHGGRALRRSFQRSGFR
eukprot:826539-Rhodomonas_salina.1